MDSNWCEVVKTTCKVHLYFFIELTPGPFIVLSAPSLKYLLACLVVALVAFSTYLMNSLISGIYER